MQCEYDTKRFLDFREHPLRLGGLGTADDGLFHADANAADDIIKLHGGNTDPWVDDYVLTAWGTPSGSVPYIGKFSHWAVTVSSATAASDAPHLWAVAAADWHLYVESDTEKFKQEVRAGLGLAPTPQIVALSAFDSDQATQTEVVRVAGTPKAQTFRSRRRDKSILVDFQTITNFALAATATSNNSTSFSANCNATLWLWGWVARNADSDLEDLEQLPRVQTVPVIDPTGQYADRAARTRRQRAA